MTVLDLITLALKQAGILGVGQSPAAEDTNDAFTLLNMMLGQWAVKRWLVYGLQDISIASTGTETYTYGLGGNFNYPQTDHLESAYARLTTVALPANQPDFNIQLINSYEDYGRIRLKSLTTFPQYVFYDNAYPLANVSFWPIPQASQFMLHLIVKQPLSAFTSLTQSINLPPQYQEPILYGLALRLRTNFQLPPDPQLQMLANQALDALRLSNAQVPRLRMPTGLRTGGGYNPISDQVT